MFHHYPDMNFDGKKDWLDGFLFHEMIREIEEKDESEKEEDLFDDDLLEDDDLLRASFLYDFQCVKEYTF